MEVSQSGLALEQPELKFEIGHVYHRQRDIHPYFGGSWQSGISSSAKAPVIFLFSGQSGEQYGYRDEFDESGAISYTGEGQLGDMTLTGGNAAIARHSADGKALHLFRSLGKGKGQRYVGEYVCAGYQWSRGPDRAGNERDVLVFSLVRAEQLDNPTGPAIAECSPAYSIAEARRLALQASEAGLAKNPSQAVQRLYQRSALVKRYVLMRAGGICESCKEPAPFKRKDGSPYLEPHHIDRLSDGGPDHPSAIGAICPACHREIHHGEFGGEKNELLRQYVSSLERSCTRVDTALN